MGIEHYAYTIIGCKVPRGALYRQAQERRCAHEYDLSFGYCPTCGAETYIMQQRALFNESTDMLGECHVILVAETQDAYVAGLRVMVWQPNTGERTPFPIDTVASREAVRNALEPLGLWDAEEKNFGIWTILEKS